jgi:hypothetical protein
VARVLFFDDLQGSTAAEEIVSSDCHGRADDDRLHPVPRAPHPEIAALFAQGAGGHHVVRLRGTSVGASFAAGCGLL